MRTRFWTSTIVSGTAAMLGCAPNLTIGVIDPASSPDGEQRIRSETITPSPAATGETGANGATPPLDSDASDNQPTPSPSPSASPTAKPTPTPSPMPAYAMLSDGMTRFGDIKKYFSFHQGYDRVEYFYAPAHVRSIGSVNGRLYADVGSLHWTAYQNMHASESLEPFSACNNRIGNKATKCGQYDCYDRYGTYYRLGCYASVYAPFRPERASDGAIRFELELKASGYPYKTLPYISLQGKLAYPPAGRLLGEQVAEKLGIQYDGYVKGYTGWNNAEKKYEAIEVVPVGQTATVVMPPGPINTSVDGYNPFDGYNPSAGKTFSVDRDRIAVARYGHFFLSVMGDLQYASFATKRYAKIHTLPMDEILQVVKPLHQYFYPGNRALIQDAALERPTGDAKDDILWFTVVLADTDSIGKLEYGSWTSYLFSYPVGRLGADIPSD